MFVSWAPMRTQLFSRGSPLEKDKLYREVMQGSRRRTGLVGDGPGLKLELCPSCEPGGAVFTCVWCRESLGAPAPGGPGAGVAIYSCVCAQSLQLCLFSGPWTPLPTSIGSVPTQLVTASLFPICLSLFHFLLYSRVVFLDSSSKWYHSGFVLCLSYHLASTTPVCLLGTIAKLLSFYDSVVFHCVHIYVCGCVSVCTPGHSVESDSLLPRGLGSTRLLCPWNSPGKNRSGLPFFSPGDVPYLAIKPAFPAAPALEADSLPLGHLGSSYLLLLSGNSHYFWTRTPTF